MHVFCCLFGGKTSGSGVLTSSPLLFCFSFSLGGNKFGDETGKAMAQALTTNTTLTWLSYGGRDAGVASLRVLLLAWGQSIGVWCANFSPLSFCFLQSSREQPQHRHQRRDQEGVGQPQRRPLCLSDPSMLCSRSGFGSRRVTSDLFLKTQQPQHIYLTLPSLLCCCRVKYTSFRLILGWRCVGCDM